MTGGFIGRRARERDKIIIIIIIIFIYTALFQTELQIAS